MRTVFLDTVGLLAVWDEDDQWHAAAEPAWQAVLRSNAILVTTAYVMLECGNAVARTPFRADVDDMRRRLELAQTLVHPTDADWATARDYRGIHERPPFQSRRVRDAVLR